MNYFHVTGKVCFWGHSPIHVDIFRECVFPMTAIWAAITEAKDRATHSNFIPEYASDSLVVTEETDIERDTRERREAYQHMCHSGVPRLFAEDH
jgi:formaldehyde-activating enzyme involved in methanogenesis